MNKYEILWNQLRQNAVRNINYREKTDDKYSKEYECSNMVLREMGQLESDFFEKQMNNGGMPNAD